MKAFLKILKITGFSLLGIVMLVVGAALCILKWPQVVINDRNLNRAANYARKTGLDLHWSSGHVSVESLAFLSKRIHLDFTDLCLRMESNSLDSCFKRVDVSAAASFVGFRPKVLELGPINLQGGRIYVKPESEAPNSVPPKDSGPSSGKFAVPQFLAETRIFPISVGIESWKVQSGTTALSGALDLKSQVDSKGQAHIGADVKAEMRAGMNAPNKLAAKLEMDNAKGFWTLDTWRLGADARGELADGTELKLKAHLDPRGQGEALTFAYNIDAAYSKKQALATVRATGIASPDHIDAHLSASARNLVPAVPLIWAHDCDLAVARVGSEIEPGTVKVNCPIHVRAPLPPKGFPDIKIPTEIGMRLIADLKTGAFPPSADAMVDGHVGVELDPILAPLFTGEGKVDSELKGVPAEFPKNFKMDTNLALQLRVPEFEHLVSQLTDTQLDIWAPARVLKGALKLDLKGRFDANSGTAPVSFQTRLTSKTQKLDINANGSIQLEKLMPSPAAHLDLDVVLADIQLELPPLPALPKPSSPKPDELPRFIPDGRIKKPINNFAKKPNTAFTYDVKIHTVDGGNPVQLLTPDAEKPIPLAVDLALSDAAPPSGSIKVMTFPLTLFKRQVSLDHLTLNLKTPSQDSQLDGKIVIPYTDYTITILLLGTSAKPQIRFLSDPPLPEDQVYATLLFGQPLDALDPDQQRSVGNSRAALREGALSLFSLYYLGSLNIESIDYDPDTKTASLKYRIAEGTSLNVSEGSGQSTVGIRKRLTKHLSITTALNNPSETQTNRTLSTFLEWSYQY